MRSDENVVIIGSGIGGTRALERLFSNTPDIEASIIVVQHIGEQLNRDLADRLNDLSEMDAKLAEDGDRLHEGNIYVAPIGGQLKIESGETISLSKSLDSGIIYPSIDLVMKSVSRENGRNVVGVILSGMRHDGVEGIGHISKIGGTAIAQSPNSAMISNKPKLAIESQNIDLICSPMELKSYILKNFEKKAALTTYLHLYRPSDTRNQARSA